jgi:hypothetical protein
VWTFSNVARPLYDHQIVVGSLYQAGGFDWQAGTYVVEIQPDVGTPQRMILATFGANT